MHLGSSNVCLQAELHVVCQLHLSVISAEQVAHSSLFSTKGLVAIELLCCLQETEASNSEAAATECAGIATYSTEECGNRPGYKQALTSHTITQVCNNVWFTCGFPRTSHKVAQNVLHHAGIVGILICMYSSLAFAHCLDCFCSLLALISQLVVIWFSFYSQFLSCCHCHFILMTGSICLQNLHSKPRTATCITSAARNSICSFNNGKPMLPDDKHLLFIASLSKACLSGTAVPITMTQQLAVRMMQMLLELRLPTSSLTICYVQSSASLVSLMQIHTILFYIAVGHILCSVIMSKIATARIQIWKKWLSDDDAHCTA